jgi:dTDP-4-dehydrorhamnose 3,5-epimerase
MIEGFKIIDLTTHKDDRGFFREVFRFSDQFNNLKVEQLSHSLVEKNVIKAWHGHIYQYQWNYVISGEINVVLYDARKKSSTYKNFIEFDIGENLNPKAYFFPPGVFHGYKCIKGPMQIIYLTSGTYDLDDEIRKSNKDLNINYKW